MNPNQYDLFSADDLIESEYKSAYTKVSHFGMETYDNHKEGEIYYDYQTNTLKVYSLGSWQTFLDLDLLQVPVYLGPTPLVRDTLEWAYQKMKEERHMEELKKSYPPLREAEDQFQAALILAEISLEQK